MSNSVIAKLLSEYGNSQQKSLLLQLPQGCHGIDIAADGTVKTQDLIQLLQAAMNREMKHEVDVVLDDNVVAEDATDGGVDWMSMIYKTFANKDDK